MSTPFIFDVLPIRFSPNPYESWQSYMQRYGDILGFQSRASVFRLFDIPLDYPITTFISLPKILNISQATQLPISVLMEMTLYFVARRFGLQSRRGIDVDAVARTLRYCPRCIWEYRYYSLAWQFPMLVGCLEHKCYLIDKCTHCGNSISLFPSDLQFGCCPSCQQELKDCKSGLLDAASYAATILHSDDIKFLLSPDVHPSIRNRDIHNRIRQLRLVRGETFKSLSLRLNMNDSHSYANFERREFNQVHLGRTIHNYLRIADCLEIDIKTLCGPEKPFLNFLQETKKKFQADLKAKMQTTEDSPIQKEKTTFETKLATLEQKKSNLAEMKMRLIKAANDIRDTNRRVTLDELIVFSELPWKAISRNTQVLALLHELIDE